MITQICSWFQEYPVLCYLWFVFGFASGIFQEVCVEEINRWDKYRKCGSSRTFWPLGFPGYCFFANDESYLSKCTLLWGQRQWWKHILAWVSAIVLAPLYLIQYLMMAVILAFIAVAVPVGVKLFFGWR